MVAVLFVGNLPDDVKSREVEDVFYKFGRIESVNVRSKGKDTFAFIEFAHHSDAEEALRRRDGYQFDSRHRMRVELSRGKKDAREDRDRRDDRGRRDDYDRKDDRKDDYGRRDDYTRRDRDDDRGYNRDSDRGYDRGYGSSRNDDWSRNDRRQTQRRERPAPKFNEKYFKVIVDNMPEGISWQDLKDFFKKNGGEDVKFTDVKDGQGTAGFETKDQAEKAIETMNNTLLKNKNGTESTVTMTLMEPQVAEEPVVADQPMETREEGRDRSRSRSRDSPRYD